MKLICLMSWFCIFVSFVFPCIVWAQSLLPYVYLTFEEEDTSSSITINFMTTGKSEPSYAYIDSRPQDQLSQFNQQVESRTGKVKGVGKTYHHVKIDNLAPNTTYYFYVGDQNIGFSEFYKFKTLPNDNTPIKVLQGGDMGPGRDIVDVAESAVWDSPHVILIGGDIAYANGKAKNEDRWVKWFENMNDIMITPDGYLLPLIVALGNHETTVGAAPFGKNPFYKELFPQNNGKSYFVRLLGAHTMLLVLDSGHIKKHKKQRDFIEESFERFADRTNRLAMYHAPLYPNHRGPNDYFARKGRKYWLKLFDKHELTAAFENQRNP